MIEIIEFLFPTQQQLIVTLGLSAVCVLLLGLGFWSTRDIKNLAQEAREERRQAREAAAEAAAPTQERVAPTAAATREPHLTTTSSR